MSQFTKNRTDDDDDLSYVEIFSPGFYL